MYLSRIILTAFTGSFSGVVLASAVGYAITALLSDVMYNALVAWFMTGVLGTIGLIAFVLTRICWRDRYKPFWWSTPKPESPRTPPQ